MTSIFSVSPHSDHFLTPQSTVLKKNAFVKHITAPYITFSFQSILSQLIRQTETMLLIMQETSSYLSSKSEKIRRTKMLSGMSESYSLKSQMISADALLSGSTLDENYWLELQQFFENDYSDATLPDPDGPGSLQDWVKDPSEKIGSIWDTDHSKHSYTQESMQALSIYFSEQDQQNSNFCQEVQSLISTLTQRYNLCLSTDTSITDLFSQLKKQIFDGLN